MPPMVLPESFIPEDLRVEDDDVVAGSDALVAPIGAKVCHKH
jgi:hypothetical protein